MVSRERLDHSWSLARSARDWRFGDAVVGDVWFFLLRVDA